MKLELIDFKWNKRYSIFSHPNYLSQKSNDYMYIGGFINQSLKFVLPWVRHNKLIFSHLQFPSSIIYVDENMGLKDEKLFMKKLIPFLKFNKIDFIIQPPTTAIFNFFPPNAKYIPFGSYIIDLQNDEETLWKNIHSKHRNVIRRAEKNCVEIKHDKNIEISHNLISQTLKRSDMNFMNLEQFKIFIDSFGEFVKIFIAYQDGTPQGCAILPWSNYSAYYIFGGSIDKVSTGSLNLLHWEAIKFFKKNNVRYYDFVGARINPTKDKKLEGIQRFKSRFGGNLKRGYLWKYELNMWKTHIYWKLHSFKYGKINDIIDKELNNIS